MQSTEIALGFAESLVRRFPSYLYECRQFTVEAKSSGRGLTHGLAREAAMTCEQCHAIMIERCPAPENEAADGEQAIVLECPQCGHTEHQPLITSFWRRLAA
jgi:hypothetical protein